MADAVVAPSPTPSTTVQPVAVQVVAPQTVTTSTETVTTPAVVETVKPATTILGQQDSPEVVAPEVKVEAVVDPAKNPEVKTETPNPLVDGAKTETQPTETKIVETQSDEPAQLPTYEPFALPDGISLDTEKVGTFNKTLAEFESLTKADHAATQAFGQKLIDRHVEEVKATVEALNKNYRDSWEKTKNDWLEAFKTDPEIGGNRQETTINSALQFIRTHGGTDAQQAEVRKLFDDTGVGNHPAIIRLLAKANMAMSEGKPLPATKPSPTKQSKPTKFYGGNTR